MAKKYLDNEGLLYFWQKIKTTFAKASDVPTKTSDLTNDSGFITSEDVPEGAAASTTTPKMNGTAAVGTETAFARGDHVHPVDTSRAPTSHASTGTTYGKGTSSNYGHVKLSDSTTATTAAASGGTAATPKAVSDALAAAKSYADGLDTGVSDVTVDGTSVVTGGVAAVDLSGKVDKVSGKGLSTNDYTTTEKNKLAGIAAGAEVNVQSDWSQTDTTADDYIKNKPTIPAADDHKWNDVELDKTRLNRADDSRIPELYDVTSTTAFLCGATSSPSSSKSCFIAKYGSDGRLYSLTPTAGDSSTKVATTAFVGTAISGKLDSSKVGAASGVCPLNASSKIDSTYLPSYVDDVIEAYARSGETALSETWLATGSASGTVITPEVGKIYVLMADSGDYTANSQFRWGGSAYVKLADGGVSSITNAEIDTIVAS